MCAPSVGKTEDLQGANSSIGESTTQTPAASLTVMICVRREVAFQAKRLETPAREAQVE